VITIASGNGGTPSMGKGPDAGGATLARAILRRN
jgi:hypothetical protein